MTFWGIFGIVTGSVFALIGIVLLLPVTLSLKAESGSDAVFSARILFAKLYASDAPPKKKKKKKGEEGKTEKKAEKKKPKFSSVAKQLGNIIDTVKSVLGDAVWLIKHFKISKLSLDAVCASDDAAKAALDYGAVCSLVYPVSGYLQNAKNVKKNAVHSSVLCDFNSEKPSFSLDCAASVRIYWIVAAALKMFFKNFKNVSEVIDNVKP